MPEKIPCPVDGCDKVFDDEAAAMAHMKAEHRSEFSAHTGEDGEQLTVKVENVPNKQDNEVDDALAMVPPGMLKLLDARMDARIGAALEAFMPQVQGAVKGAIEQVVAQARAQGVPIPAITGTPGEGGVIAGSPVTPAGAELIKLMFGGGGGTDIDTFIKQANQYKALGDLFNPPPSLADRIITSAYVKNLKKLDLVTDKAMAKLDKELFGDEV